MKWYNPQKDPFRISGFSFYEQDCLYRRMPLNPGTELPEAMYNLADETSGGQIRFHTKAKKMSISVSVASKKLYFDGNSIWHENVVDGLHKTDLGYLATAKGLYKLLKTIL